MKNAFKLSVVAFAISLSLLACKGNKYGSNTDSAKIDSSTSIKTTTDTAVKVDTTKPATDTSKANTDTVTKIVKKSTVKKTVIKKTE